MARGRTKFRMGLRRNMLCVGELIRLEESDLAPY